MISDQPFGYDFPILVTGLVYVSILLATLEVGYRLGLKQSDSWKDAESGGGNLVLTSMFALMGLIVAFTYAAGVSRNETRKQGVILEANALGTAFLRANLVEEPGRTKLKQALLDYARTRTIDVGVVTTNEIRRQRIQLSTQQLAKLWPLTEEIVRQRKTPGPIEASLVAAVNEVIDVHAVRIAGIEDKLPRAVIWLLILISGSCLIVTGFNAGISGKMSRWRMTILALVMAGVLLVIVDFDRPGDGLIQLNQTSLYNVIADMEADLAK